MMTGNSSVRGDRVATRWLAFGLLEHRNFPSSLFMCPVTVILIQWSNYSVVFKVEFGVSCPFKLFNFMYNWTPFESEAGFVLCFDRCVSQLTLSGAKKAVAVCCRFEMRSRKCSSSIDSRVAEYIIKLV